MRKIAEKLTEWYLQNKRDLPWRKTRDPYKIWLSEIIFQQTRIDQGLAYYQRFVSRYPDIHQLAMAEEEEVLKMWQGLGYYSRARNLLETAKKISFDCNGVFPASFREIKALKGVGDYTAAAIASIAFDVPVPVVDGNVLRVITRLFNIRTPIDSLQGKKEVKHKMEQLISDQNPGDFNQAVMELGALVCKPQRVLCDQCVLNKYCKALQMNSVSELPMKQKKVEVRHRYFHYFVLNSGEMVLIRKRTGNDIWKNLFDFPMIETTNKSDLKKIHHRFAGMYQLMGKYDLLETKSITHLLTHRKLHVTFSHYKLYPDAKINLSADENLRWVSIDELNNFPFPQLIRKYLDTNENML